MVRLTDEILEAREELHKETADEEEFEGMWLSAGRADCKMSAKLVPVQFSLAAVSLTWVISSGKCKL